jgi:hypothetical protein
VPNWQPNWEDVRWNWAAAEVAASGLDHRADGLELESGVWQQASNFATPEWRGVYRLQFDDELTSSQSDVSNESAQLHLEAARIRRASELAREEQTRRERDRARWRAEKAAEDAAAARARAHARQLAQQQAASGG